MWNRLLPGLNANLSLQHIYDNSLELYALGRSSGLEVVAIQEHLLVCNICFAQFEEMREFAAAMKVAVQEMVTQHVVSHDTEDGIVHLYVRPISPTNWVATMRGKSVSAGLTAATCHDAASRCQDAFVQMFPEHVCTGRCKRNGK